MKGKAEGCEVHGLGDLRAIFIGSITSGLVLGSASSFFCRSPAYTRSKSSLGCVWVPHFITREIFGKWLSVRCVPGYHCFDSWRRSLCAHFSAVRGPVIRAACPVESAYAMGLFRGRCLSSSDHSPLGPPPRWPLVPLRAMLCLLLPLQRQPSRCARLSCLSSLMTAPSLRRPCRLCNRPWGFGRIFVGLRVP